MKAENKDWKPKVGEKVWVLEKYMVLQKTVLRVDLSGCALLRGRRGDDFYEGFKCHPTAEAALASIKIYDLEGKEVVIPRAEPTLDEMVEAFNKWIKIEDNLKLFLGAQAKQRPQSVSMGKYIDRAKEVIGGGAANGGKSEDQIEEI